MQLLDLNNKEEDNTMTFKELEQEIDKIEKTVHQVVPVPRFPMLNCFLQSFVLKPFYAIRRAIGHLFSLLSMIFRK